MTYCSPIKPMLIFLGALLINVSAQAEPLQTLYKHGTYVGVEAYAPNIVRITIGSDQDTANSPPGYGFIAQAENKHLRFVASEAGEDFTSDKLKLHVNAQPWPKAPSMPERYFLTALPQVGLNIKNNQGETLLTMTGWEKAPLEVNGEKTFEVEASFAAPADEHFYGLGQNQEGFLDLRGRSIDCKHWYDAPHGETVCIPFMISTKGYGIIWDNPSATRVTPAVNGVTRWRSHVGERVSYFVITGTPAEIWAGYAKLTGKTPIPPKAAFGLIQSKARYESQKQILDVAQTYRTKQYPLDIMVVDWFYWTRMGELDIDSTQFPDSLAMNRQLHAMGLQSIISIWPRFEKASRYFNELDSKGYLLKNKEGQTQDGLPYRNDRTGGLIDSTNPAARKWFWEHARDGVISQGFDYPWLDETEPDLVPDGMFFSIGSGDRYRNVYPLVHVEGVAEGLKAYRPNKRSLILARAAYLGSQRTGGLFWSSDINPSWDALQRQIPTGLNMTASGIAYWGNDIGGWQWLPSTTSALKTPLLDPSDAREVVGNFHDYPELFTRWFQYGTFLPTLRIHGMRPQNELWSFGKQAEAVLAQYDRFRYQLIPYIYSHAKITFDTGAPFMRALWFDFPKDEKLYNLGSQYMFGSAFLVAPVTEQGQTLKEVYLPAGADWYNFWTKEKFTGGQTIKVAAPIDKIPLFVKAGSIIPIGQVVQSTASVQAIEKVLVFSGVDADFTLYDDDGVSQAYLKGKSSTSYLHWDDKNRVLTAKGDLSGKIKSMTEVIGK